MVTQKTAKKILNKVNELKLYEFRGKQYFDTHNLGIEVWYKTFLKMGREEPIFMEAIESPDKKVAIQTAHKMGQKRDLRKIVEAFYKGKLASYKGSIGVMSFPAGFPVEEGPIGLVIQSKIGSEFIGFEFDHELYKFKNDPYNLLTKLCERYASLNP